MNPRKVKGRWFFWLAMLISVSVLIARSQAQPALPAELAAANLQVVSNGTLYPNQTLTFSYKVPEGHVQHASYEWVGLFPVGSSQQATYKWVRPAIPEGTVSFTAPATPGFYEVRYMSPTNGGWPYRTILKGPTLLIAAAGSDPIGAPTIPVRPNISVSTPQENANQLQLAIDKAVSEGRDLLLPSAPRGLRAIPLIFTPERRNLRIWGSLNIRSESTTCLRGGPDNPGLEWTLIPNSWAVWKIDPGNFEVTFEKGIEGEGPLWKVHEILWAKTPDGQPGPHPDRQVMNWLEVSPATEPCRRIVRVFDPRLYVELAPLAQPQRGFQEAFVVLPGHPESMTDLLIKGGDIETLAQGVVAFGDDRGLIDVYGARLNCGFIYPPDHGQNGYGNTFYVHQNRQLKISRSVIITRGGRGGVKYAGRSSEGRSHSAVVADSQLACDRVNLKRALGMSVSPEDYHWGEGIGWDKSIAGLITGCWFDRSLSTGVRHWGEVNISNSVFECPYVLGQAGDQTGEKPIISLSNCRLNDTLMVVHGTMENAIWKFDNLTIDSPGNSSLFGSSVRPQTFILSNSFIRMGGTRPLYNPGGEGSTWKETNVTLLRK